MRATRVRAHNFKGRSFSEALYPVTVFVGPNAAGKSARLEALYLALLGYMPGDKPVKSGRDLFDTFASGSPMEVAVECDGAHFSSVVRKWEEKKGSVKYSGPDGPSLPAVLLDPSAYTALTGPGRLRYLLKLVPGGGLSVGKTADVLAANLKNFRLEQNSAATEAALARAAETVREVAAKSAGGDVVDFLDALSSKAAVMLSTARASVERLEHTLQGYSQTAEASSPPGNAEEAERRAAEALRRADAEHSALDAELRAARQEWAATSAKAKAAAGPEAEEKLAEVRAEVSRLAEATKDRPAAGAEREAWRKAVARRSEATARVQVAASALGAAKAEAEAAAKPDAKCPECGQPVSPAKIKKRQAAAAAGLEKAEKSLADFKAAASEAAVAEMEAEKAAKEAEARVSAWSESNSRLAAAASEASHLQREVDAAKDASAAAAKLPELTERGAKLGERCKEAAARAAELRAKHEEARKAADALLVQRSEARSRARVSEEASSAKAEAEVAKQLAELAAALQREVVEKASGPLVASVNMLCEGFVPSPVVYRDGELSFAGWTHRSASDSEKVMLYAGLCLALAAGSPLKLATVGRLESLDSGRREKLVALAASLVAAGKVDQCVMVEVATSYEAAVRRYEHLGEGVKVVEVSP